MENFKKALKQAITEKADAVLIEDGQAPQLLSAMGQKSLQNLPVMTTADVQTLMEGLLSNGENLTDRAREGVLAIVNFGELKLIGHDHVPLRLYAFIPPHGDEMYQKIRQEIINLSVPPMNPMLKQTVVSADADPFMAQAFAPASTNTEPEIKRHQPTEVASGHGYFSLAGKGEFAPNPNEASFLGLGGSDLSLPSAMPRGVPPDTQEEDYHYLSHKGAPDSALSIHAYVPGQDLDAPALDQHGQPQAMMPMQQMQQAYQPPMPAAQAAVDQKIHFGAHIPGETIDRNGQAFPIDAVLHEMIKLKASDLHLTPGEVMCMRIDGDIARVGKDIMQDDMMEKLLLPIIPPRNKEEFLKVSDTDFAYEVPGLARFRVNMYRDRMGVGAVLRQIPEKILSADQLGLPPAVRKFCELQKGLVVVTGPTGSGKSTTLAGMVDLINETRHDHILTIEDPIEFVHQQKNCLLNQREVHRHTQSFSRALRAALREDPDIILIGEMRDLETVEIAIETAETGHLVFGTLHTNTAISTVDRLIDQFPADQQAQIRVMLSESLKGVVAQTLVKKKGGGRVAALEILVVDKAVAALIREGNTHMMGNHMQTQKSKGNILLNDSLLNLVVKGVVEAKDAYAKSIEKEAFAAMLQAKGIALDLPKAS